MRAVLLAVLFLFPSKVSAADPTLPPIVFQTQPLGRILDALRAGADIVGGEKAVKALNTGFKELLGEKGFEGLDISRPVVGYVVLAPKPEDITAVIALPVTGEKEFLGLCDRVNKDKLKADEKDKTLYHLPPLDPRYKALMRFKDRYAYIAYGANPAPQIESAALVSMEKLLDPAERGLVAARFFVERVPLPVLLAGKSLLEEVRKNVFDSSPIGRDKDVQPIARAAASEFEKLVARYIKYAPDVDTVAARLLLDAGSGNLIVEATLSGKPNTELAKTIAAFNPTPHRFAALAAHPETVGALTFRLPLYEAELRTAAVLGLEAAQKEAHNSNDPGKAAGEEFFKALARTARAGELDLALAVRGPDKNGWFTLLGALACDDTKALEKAFRDYIDKNPDKGGGETRWDVAKGGNVSIHTLKLTPGGFIDPSKVFGGENCTIAFAFAPKGIFLAMGPEAVGTLKEALTVQAAPAPVLEFVLNPARTTKLIHKIMGPDDPDIAEVEIVLGKEDKLRSILSATLEGGKELRAAVTINLRVLPRAALYSAIQRSEDKKNVDPPGPVGK